MQLILDCARLALILLVAHLCQADWVKRYEENYHRPHYYNRRHKVEMHVNYNRAAMDRRDLNPPLITKAPLPPFSAEDHLSYYVNILYKESVICAGALISRRMVITSSRCFIPDENEPTLEFKAKYMSVKTGIDFLNNELKPWRVNALFMPIPEDIQGVHNIALISLAEKLTKDDYRYIPFLNRMPSADDELKMAFLDASHFNITLYNTKLVDAKICQSEYKEKADIDLKFNDQFYCVENRADRGCSTRPGDPVIVDNKLVGINIYGEHCDELQGGKLVDVYFATRHTIPFIQRATNLLRAFTGTGPFNSSFTTKRTQLLMDTVTAKSELIQTG